MRIAVTYENDEIFQHFGHSEAFKLYDVEDGKVVNSQVVEASGRGHGALAGMMSENDVKVVICGGIGDGATSALADAGIEVFSGAKGSCDEAVAKYLAGELVSEGTNCDHHDHHHEEEEEGCGCGGDCGDDCSCGGGCGGGCGCGTPQVIYEGPNAGKTVRTHYRGTFNDGTEFDSSYGRGEPLEFICGVGMMIPGYDKAVVNMKVGETVNIHLMPEEAYGQKDPNAIMEFEIANLPGSEEFSVGDSFYLKNSYGQSFPVTVTAKDNKNITLDANHEMAGKELNFQIELVEIVE